MDFTRRGYAAELGIVKGSQTDEVVVKDVFDRIPSAYDEVSNPELLAGLDAR
jgi:extradiol dioxygenase family protein